MWFYLILFTVLATKNEQSHNRREITKHCVSTLAENSVLMWGPVNHSKKLVEKIGFQGL